jgi:hypothetical protein
LSQNTGGAMNTTVMEITQEVRSNNDVIIDFQ